MVKDREDQVVEKELKQVEKGKQTPKEAEKDIAESITKEQVKKTQEKEKSEDKIEKPEKEKQTEKTREKKSEEKPIRKNIAVVNGKNLPISTKHAVAICNFIKNKDIDQAIIELELVKMKKIPVPMKGEIPHRKGIMSGRYPVKAAHTIIRLLKSLKANAIVNELEIEKYKMLCIANIASRPYKRFGQKRFKRTNITLKLTPLNKKQKK